MKDWTKITEAAFAKAFSKRFPQFLPTALSTGVRVPYMGTVGVHRGWQNILWKLTEGIEAELKKTPISEFEISQIKEKFGGLRYYISFGNKKIFKLISDAEDESFKTCEWCGALGTLDGSYHWLLTLCKKCREKRRKEKEREKQSRFEEMVRERQSIK